MEGAAMIRILLIILVAMLAVFSVVQAEETTPRGDLLIIQGSAGEEEYGTLFTTWASRWEKAANQGGLQAAHVSSGDGEKSQKDLITEFLVQQQPESTLPLWIVMIGHGTYDGRAAKLNLEGPDLSAKELDGFLAKVSRPTIIINCSSSSAPFLEALSQDNRIVLTSTRSGEQVNFSRFGEFLSLAIGDSAADLDKDKQTSLLEAFLSASRKTVEYYEADGRIPTENALLDDNGDGKGTRATAFQGFRAVAKPQEKGTLLDGFRAHQLHLIANDADKDLSPEVIAQRNELEQEIELLRSNKSNFTEDEYYSKLEKLFLEMAELVLQKNNTAKKTKSE